MKRKDENNEDFNDEQQDINVFSYNQSGGITAYNVNLGAPARHVNDNLIESLKAHLPSDQKEIEITAVMGDQEAFQFASEIKEYLESKGLKVNGVNQAIFSQPVVGQNIEKVSESEIKIIIGSRQ